MNFTLRCEPDQKIIFYKHWGNLKTEDIGYVWENKFLKMPEFTELGYNLFSDYSEAIFDMSVKDVDFIIEFMRHLIPILKGKKQSIIITDPTSTAASLIFENEVNQEIGFNVKIFSTKEAALKWLQSS
nr:hypothetical protein [uncultured Draconibacterium sp.]